MASYPSAVKTYTTKLDGAGNFIAAAHVNDLQAEVTAVEDGLLNGIQHDLTLAENLQFVGTAATDVLLKKNGSAILALRKGDDSGYASLELLTLNATGSVQTSASGLSFVGVAATDVLLKKNGSAILAIRAGDDSAYGSLEALTVNATGSVQTGTAGVSFVGTTANDVLLKKNGTAILALRTGNDGAYASLEILSLNATGVVNVSDGSEASPSVAFTNDTNTGLYLIAAGSIGITLNGALGVGFTDKTSAQGYGAAAASGAFGTGNVAGSFVQAGRNSSGSGAAGTLRLQAANGTMYYVWVDTAGKLRIGTSPPEEDGSPADTSGTIVGTQA